MHSIRTVYLLAVVRNCKSNVLILTQLLVRNCETIYRAGPYRHQWGTGHSPLQTPVGHRTQPHTDTSGAQDTAPYRHQWDTGHSPIQAPVGHRTQPIQTPVGHKAQAHTDTSGAQGTAHTGTSGAQGTGTYRH